MAWLLQLAGDCLVWPTRAARAGCRLRLAAVAVCLRPTGDGAHAACCLAGRRLLLPRPGSLRGAMASVWRWSPAYMCEEGAGQAVEVDDPPSGAPPRPRRRIYVVPRLALARRHSCPRPRMPPQPCVDGGARMRRRWNPMTRFF
jgi:hypothetical protein